MKKGKLLASILAVALAGSMMVACGSDSGSGSKKSDLKVGMVTDSGTIDDKSFNQGTWEGIKSAEKNLGISKNYLKPSGETAAHYMTEIGNLYDTGYKFIVTPGFKFEQAILEAQDKYTDAKFVIIDGKPNNGVFDSTRVEKIGDNTVSIFFAEEQAGFLGGVAAALQIKEGNFGFIGGMEIPAVQKFNWGFQQGVNYANENLNTKIEMKAENFVYQGTFYETAAGQAIAAQMYDRGVNVIFTAAGGTGLGAIKEAKERAASGEEVWIVGVDVDQYAEGIYEGKIEDKDEKSIILTSAVKKLAKVTEDMIKDEIDGKFQGGKLLMYDASNDGIGIPDKNPNLDEKVVKEVNKVYEKIKSGDIKVSPEEVKLAK